MISCDIDHFVGEEGTIFYVDCGVDVSLASVAKVYLEKPDASTIVEKTAEAITYNGSTNYIRFTIAAGDLDQVGEYKCQAYIEMGAWKGRGKTFIINVLDDYGIEER